MGVYNEHLNRSLVTGFDIKTVQQKEELACLPLSFDSHVFPKAKDLSKCKIDMIAAAPIEANQRPEDSALEINDLMSDATSKVSNEVQPQDKAHNDSFTHLNDHQLLYSVESACFSR